MENHTVAKFDMVIRGGLVADGLGGEPVHADVAVTDGKIAAVGSVKGSTREEIDAKGLLVTPGFVDIHTHLDGQVTWTNCITPSSLHGVTTAIFGNCGVGFAPCRPEDRDRLVSLMEGVEDIPEPVLTEGLPWNWTSFPEFLDRLEARNYDIDIGAQLPHAPLRVFVMGERAVKLEPASPDDITQMAALADEAMRAGALGFSTSRSINHRASDGSHTPTLEASEAELTGIAIKLGAGGGVIQMIADFEDVDTEFDMIQRVAQKSGRPLSMTVIQMAHAPERWRRVLGRIAKANEEGLKIKGQVCGRPVGVLIGFELSFCSFSFCPTYQEIAALPFSEKMARLREPETRRRIIEEFAVPLESRAAEIKRAFASRTVDSRSTARLITNLERIFPMGTPPNYEPTPEESIAAVARRAGKMPAELAYDMLLENGGRTLFYVPASNYADCNLEAVSEMLKHDDTVLGLSDAGAHCSLICDVSFSTYMMTHWARDRKPGLPLGEVVRQLTSQSARTVGLTDRGVLADGYRADINIIDLKRLSLHPPRVIYDLPAGGKRLSQDAEGYVVTIVNGVPTYREGVHTGALPGRLVRRRHPTSNPA
jgi:N-acyl-D-aspartate/D-glutamate deacylase